MYRSDSASMTESGELVSVKNGTQTSTAFSCINVLAQDIAKLPFNVRKDTEQGKEIIKSTPVYKLIHTRPNNYTTAYNFWYKIVWDILSCGNAYVYIKRGLNYQPSSLHCLDPKDVKAKVIEDEVYYEINKEWFGGENILHFKLYSFDGVEGVSPIIYNAETFGYRIKQDKYKAKVLGTKPSGLLSFEEKLSDTQMDQARQMWKRMTTGAAKGETPVLGGGAKYTPFMIPPNEGQMIEAAKLSREEIAGLYRVPPTMIQDYERATFSNAEQQSIIYLRDALTPILKVIEQECDYKLFSERSGLYTKFNFNAILRGDIQTRMEMYKTLRSFGLASADEIREMEDLPPLEENGDLILVQGAMMPLNKSEEFYSNDSSSMDENQRQIGFQKLKERMQKIEQMNNTSITGEQLRFLLDKKDGK